MEKEGLSEQEEIREEQETGVGFPARQVTYREALPTNKWNPGREHGQEVRLPPVSQPASQLPW